MKGQELEPQSSKCLMCGIGQLHKFKASASDVAKPTYINIVECKNCFFAWQYPLKREEQQSIEFFENAYADDGVTESQYFNADFKREVSKLEYGFVAGLPVEDKTILDIGAGSGLFAYMAFENNWEVMAVDPALDSDKVKSSDRINMIKGSIDQIPKGELFDVVTLWDVIEHVASPVQMINNAKNHIKDGGWLVIETGNYKSLGRINGGKNHWIYQLDHRWYFSPDSIESLLKEAGFSEFVLSEKVLRPGWSGVSEYAGPSRAQLLMAIIKTPLRIAGHISDFYYLSKAKEWRAPGIGIFTIAARKPNKVNGNS